MGEAMTRHDELGDVIRLACLTAHRSDREQRSLIAVAWRSDVEHNRNTSSNPARRDPAFALQDLVGLVAFTRELEAPDRVVPMPKTFDRSWARWRAGE